MRQLSSFVLILSVFEAIGQSGEKNFIDQNYIEVTGKSDMQITPDLISLKIILSDKDKNRVSIAEEEKMMTNKLQELGIDVKKDLTIDDLLSYYHRTVFSKRDVILSKEYRLTVHDVKTATQVLKELEKLDISNVSIAKLDHTKMLDFKKELKIKAIVMAKEKAEYLTRAVNQGIGRAIFIEELDNSSTNAQIAYALKDKAYTSDYANYQYTAAQEDANLDFEKIRLEYSILARFELK